MAICSNSCVVVRGQKGEREERKGGKDGTLFFVSQGNFSKVRTKKDFISMFNHQLLCHIVSNTQP